MKGKEVVHSSGRDDWGTPLWLFKYLDSLYHFGLDAAASEDTTLCDHYYSEKNSALTHHWGGFGNIFVNPPYSLNQKFLDKAVDESDGENSIVMLLPARVDTKWWHDYVMPWATKVIFIRGRLTFQGATAGAPFPSCIVEFSESVAVQDDAESYIPIYESLDQRMYKNG